MRDEQWTLEGEPPTRFHPNNLPRRLIDGDGIVIQAIWLSYGRSGDPVGDCRECGGPIYAERPIPMGNNRIDYVAACPNKTCLKEVAFPNGRTGRWDETHQRGRKRPLPRGLVAIAKNAVGQTAEES